MKKMLTLILTLGMLLTALPTLATDGTGFSLVDVSNMSPEEQASWYSLFEMTDEWSHFGDLGRMARQRPGNEGWSLTHFEAGNVMKISGHEPVEMSFNGEIFINTAGERPEGHCNLWFVMIPETGDYKTTNSEVAVKWLKYPIIEGHERAYWYDEYRFMASQLLMPVKENGEKPCEVIDVFFQSMDRILHKGVITVEFNFNENCFQLVMRPAK